jgi:hypothetical protein
MSWEEAEKIKRDIIRHLDSTAGKTSDAAGVGSTATIMGWIKAVYAHLTNNLSAARAARIDSIAASALISNNSAVKQIIRGQHTRNNANNYSLSVSFGTTVNPQKTLAFATGYIATKGTGESIPPSIISVSASGFIMQNPSSSASAAGSVCWQAIEFF